MTITLNFFEYDLVYVIMIILGIIQGSSLVIGCRIFHEDLNGLRFVKGLIIAGGILTGLYITIFFIPTSIDVSSPTKSEELAFFFILLLNYDILPDSVFIILGIALLLFFYKNNHIYQKLLLYTSIVLVTGNVLSFVNSSLARSLIHFDVYTYLDFADYFLALDIISLCIQLGAILIILLYCIYLNNRGFMIFSSLYLVYLFSSLIPLLPYI
ncbi:MAG: hypothetical protein KGD58_00720 [Candidatus Lokiarchaeota archaeon]|nr:hypothetical protein [Candidatus Lokiarchaeota archaeon]